MTDSDIEMVQSAIATLGNLKAEEAQNDLIDLFFAQPDLRPAILTALASIGGSEAESIMIPATHIRFGGNLGRIYRLSPDLRQLAIKSLGQCAGKNGAHALRRFIRILNNLFIRVFFFPLRSMGKRKEILKLTQDALARIEFRLNSKT